MILRNLRGILLLTFLFMVSPFSAFAQNSSRNLESCFVYYNYGKVLVDLSSEKTTYDGLDSIKLHGSIVNKNTFPLIDVVVYAHIKRKNEKSLLENGHYLIDKMTLLENVNLLPGETKSLELNLPLKFSYPQGEYQLQYFVFSPNSFHYGGRPFFEEDYAGTTDFMLSTGPKPDVFFDIDGIRIDNQLKTLRGLTYESSEKTIGIDIPINDSRETKSPLSVGIKFYSFEDSLENRLVSQTRATLEDSSQPLHVDFTPPEKGAYVMVVELESPVRSMFKYRFAAIAENKKPAVRINDIGATSFPSTANGRAWVCFHSPTNELSPNAKVVLSVLNSNQDVLEQTSITDSFSPDVYAISVPLTKLGQSSNFWVEAQLINTEDEKQNQTVKIHYNCSKFTKSLKDFSVTYIEDEPPLILIEGTDACGNKFQGGTVNLIRIIQNGVTKKEETNVSGLPYTVSLDGLPSGTYTAQVLMGETTKKIDFEINTQPLAVRIKVNFQVFVWILILIIVSVSVYILYKNKKNT